MQQNNIPNTSRSSNLYKARCSDKWMPFQFLKRCFTVVMKKASAQTPQTQKYYTAINGSSRHCFNVACSGLPNTEREFPPRETPLARCSRVNASCTEGYSRLYEESSPHSCWMMSMMMKGGFGRRAAVMQSFSPRAAWVCAPAGVLYLELQLPFLSSRLH